MPDYASLTLVQEARDKVWTTLAGDISEKALSVLHQIAGSQAAFHAGQREAIEALVSKKGRLLVVQRTGWGKSAVYFIATKLLRNEGAGPTLLVSPLLALMRNQIEMAERAGIRAHTINSSNKTEHEKIHELIENNDVDVLLISPERLNNPDFRKRVLAEVASSTGLLVIDEAHCISDWGHDFRPDYRRVVDVLRLLPKGVPVLATTATANDRVIQDVEQQIGRVETIRGSLARTSLALYARSMPSQAERLAWLAQTIPTLDGSGIVYCMTIRDTEVVAEWLRRHEIDAVAYSGQTDVSERPETEQRLIEDNVKVIVATSALGMGFDKPNLAFVIHYQSPGSVIAYYQQVGRAGRALDHAIGVLLRGVEDKDIQDYFISTAFPREEDATALLKTLEEADSPLKGNALLARINTTKTKLDKLLKTLEVEGAVERTRGGYQRTLNPWKYDSARVERVTQQRIAEQEAMRAYVDTNECLMQELRRHLDDPHAEPCGRCMNCAGSSLSWGVDPSLVREAAEFLRSRDFNIEPRKQWPYGLETRSGPIPEELRLEKGRTLSLFNDGGWGSMVKRGKDEGAFPDELVSASAQLIETRWRPHPAPTWVTCVPSKEHPELVPDFARRLADKLGLAFQDIVQKIRSTEPQKSMRNSQMQFRNVHEAFGLTGDVPNGPVLLVDDMVDSKWTLTVIGTLLREAGSGPVFPFALANSQGRD